MLKTRTMPEVGLAQEIRRHHLGTLLRQVHLGGPVSRTVLAERMGLNRSTIMALTAELTSAGLVREELPKDTGRAGPPALVGRPEANPGEGVGLGVAVGPLGRPPGGVGGTR